MDTKKKKPTFIEFIEEKMILSADDCFLLYKANENLQAGSIVVNGNQCVNGSSACQGSINDSRCSNGNCDNSTNGRKCTVLTPSTGLS